MVDDAPDPAEKNASSRQTPCETAGSIRPVNPPKKEDEMDMRTRRTDSIIETLTGGRSRARTLDAVRRHLAGFPTEDASFIVVSNGYGIPIGYFVDAQYGSILIDDAATTVFRKRVIREGEGIAGLRIRGVTPAERTETVAACRHRNIWAGTARAAMEKSAAARRKETEDAARIRRLIAQAR